MEMEIKNKQKGPPFARIIGCGFCVRMELCADQSIKKKEGPSYLFLSLFLLTFGQCWKK